MIVNQLVKAMNGHFRHNDPRKKTLQFLATALNTELAALQADGKTELLDKSKWTPVSLDEAYARTAFGQIEILARLLDLDPDVLKSLTVPDLIAIVEAVNTKILAHTK
jgi:hypothetical protein